MPIMKLRKLLKMIPNKLILMEVRTDFTFIIMICLYIYIFFSKNIVDNEAKQAAINTLKALIESDVI